jgi:hypothetical protein
MLRTQNDTPTLKVLQRYKAQVSAEKPLFGNRY